MHSRPNARHFSTGTITLRQLTAMFCLCAGACFISAERAESATGLQFLKIGAGARAMALGNAVVSNVDDPSATYWNPGALALISGTRAELAHSESFQSVRYEFASLTRNFGRHAAGGAFHGIWTDRLNGFDEAGEATGDFGYAGLILNGSYGFLVADGIGIGVGVEYVREQIDIDDATVLAFNFGLQAREILPRTSFGLTLLHAGSSGAKYNVEEFDLPVTVQAGLTHAVPLQAMNGRLLVSAEFRSVQDGDSQFLVGTEYRYQDITSLQVGYQTEHDTQDVSFGFSVGRDRVLGQYAFAPFGENLGDQHRFSIQLHW